VVPEVVVGFEVGGEIEEVEVGVGAEVEVEEVGEELVGQTVEIGVSTEV